MVEKAREAPVSYLNKGQEYKITVVDRAPPTISSDSIQYRTFVRVSFDDEEQKKNTAACWQLWEEGRGLRESTRRGGKLLAVEFMGQKQKESSGQHQMRFEQTSFDGFCVTWTAIPANENPTCSIFVRFNFLSTDFTQSKGVKGVPVRLCSKTQVLSSADDAGPREPEICYCKIKVFRDHGAERKLSQDIAHVQKTIEKLKQQVKNAEMDGGLGKRKRGTRVATKLNKFSHTRSFQGDAVVTMTHKKDLQSKVAVMQDMLLSAQQVSVLALRGNMEDDPDLYPACLQSEGNLVETELLVLPTSPKALLDSSDIFLSNLKDLKSHQNTAATQNFASRYKTSEGPIEAGDMVRALELSTEQLSRPSTSLFLHLPEMCRYLLILFKVAFFSSRSPGKEQQASEQYFAVYLTERTVRDLTNQICKKHDLEPARVLRILPKGQVGLRNVVDGGFKQLPECQDIDVDNYETPRSARGDNDDWPDAITDTT